MKVRRKVRTMALARDFRKTDVARVKRDPASARALLHELAAILGAIRRRLKVNIEAHTVDLRKLA